MSIPKVLRNFLNSEKGIIAIALLIGATVLASIGKMTIASWQDYSIWIFGIYTGGKSIQGAAAHLAGSAKEPDTDKAVTPATDSAEAANAADDGVE